MKRWHEERHIAARKQAKARALHVHREKIALGWWRKGKAWILWHGSKCLMCKGEKIFGVPDRQMQRQLDREKYS